MAQIAYVVKLTAAEGKRDEALAALGKLVAATEDEPGTVQYLMHTEVNEPTTMPTGSPDSSKPVMRATPVG